MIEPSPESPLQPNSIPGISPRARIQTDKVTGNPVLISQESVLILNATAADILALCDGKRKVCEISAKLATQYNAPVEVISTSIVTYLTKLKQLNLVSWRE